MYDLIVIGGGPAGLTAAIYAIRRRLNVLLVSRDLGGKTNYHPYMAFEYGYQTVRGTEVVDKFKRELEYLDFVRLIDTVSEVKPVSGNGSGSAFSVRTGDGKELKARTVIVATGAGAEKLGIPGEQEFMGRGVFYSALSYAPHFVDKTTAVLGDGPLALRASAELALVATHVYLIGQLGQVLDSPLGQKLAAAKNTTILAGYHPVAITGKDSADHIVVAGPDGHKQVFPVDGVFIEQGLIPQTGMVQRVADLDKQGRIKVDERNNTSVPGLFAAGDVTDTYAEQVLVAVGEGAKAALSAYNYLLPAL